MRKLCLGEVADQNGENALDSLTALEYFAFCGIAASLTQDPAESNRATLLA
jgi:hypothetical protein